MNIDNEGIWEVIEKGKSKIGKYNRGYIHLVNDVLGFKERILGIQSQRSKE